MAFLLVRIRYRVSNYFQLRVVGTELIYQADLLIAANNLTTEFFAAIPNTIWNYLTAGTDLHWVEPKLPNSLTSNTT